ncbi:MAG: hypothetical protein ACRYFU_17430 [Janthinobacterium lividum]
MVKMLGDLLPDPQLNRFALNKLFPRFAGLNLESLLPNMNLSREASRYIHVTRGFNQASRSAWVKTDIRDMPLAHPGNLFSLGPVTLAVEGPTFGTGVLLSAQVEVTTAQKQRASAALRGNWKLQLGGTELITFRNTQLSFDEQGHVHFDLRPQDVELNGVLRMLQETIGAAGSGGGFSTEASAVGVTTRYVLALPKVGGGPSGISNLTFGFELGLEFAPFAISTGFSLGQ